MSEAGPECAGWVQVPRSEVSRYGLGLRLFCMAGLFWTAIGLTLLVLVAQDPTVEMPTPFTKVARDAPSRVWITSEPLGARVFVDEIYVGSSPTVVELHSELSHLRLERHGFSEELREVERAELEGVTQIGIRLSPQDGNQ